MHLRSEAEVSDPSYSNAGNSLFTLLLVLFIGLKLGHVIDWEWWLVLTPLWGPIVMVIAVLVVIGLGICAVGLWDAVFGDPMAKRRRR
jgi:hypothetical protein